MYLKVLMFHQSIIEFNKKIGYIMLFREIKCTRLIYCSASKYLIVKRIDRFSLMCSYKQERFYFRIRSTYWVEYRYN